MQGRHSGVGRLTEPVAEVQEQDLITATMSRMEGDGEKREVSTGGNGREVNSERVVPGRQIIGTWERLVMC